LVKKKKNSLYFILFFKKFYHYICFSIGLLKKVNEISTLCGIEACAIIFGENNAQPEVWPQGPATRNVLSKFLHLPEIERSKNMVDLTAYLNQSIAKSQLLLKKQMEANKKNEFVQFITKVFSTGQYRPEDVNVNELNDLMAFIDNNLKEIDWRLQSMEIQSQEEAGNGAEDMNGIGNEGNKGDASGLVNVGDMQANMGHGADVQGLDSNMNYGMESDYQDPPWDFSMLAFHDVNTDINGLWSN
jgi:hypothetical protein